MLIATLSARGYSDAIEQYFKTHPRFDEVARDEVIAAVAQFSHVMSKVQV
jgi:hypothetical protein